MSIKVFVDTKEVGLQEKLSTLFKDFTFESKTLVVGDVLYTRDDTEVCVIERKTYKDYAASIVDKRLNNQKLRISELRNSTGASVIYLIEGTLKKDFVFENGITASAISTSLVNTTIRDKFSVYPSISLEDSARFVVKVYECLLKLETTPKQTERTSYLKTIKLNKKENMTPDNCYVCQLSQIPGVSITIANAICNEYKTFPLLISAYNSTEDKHNLLADIKFDIANNKKRRIGNVVSKRVYEYLYHV